MHRRTARSTAALVAVAALALGSTAAGAAPGSEGDRGPRGGRQLAPGSPADRVPSEVLAYWTPERIAGATPRDLLIDEQGLGYLRRADGQLERYGSGVAPAAAGSAPSPTAKPDGVGNGKGNGGGDDDGSGDGGSGEDDGTGDDGGVDDEGDDAVEPGPVFGERIPAEGAVVESTTPQLSAVVTALDGIRSVSFELTASNGATFEFTAAAEPNDTYVVDLADISEGEWTWTITARDASKGRGITRTSAAAAFTVDVPELPDGDDEGGSGVEVVANERWKTDDTVAAATGRILFAMPERGNKLTNYVCSGAVVDDGGIEGSRILTAAHCIYDDVNGVFATKVLFIPDQDGTEGTGTDSDCSNDPYGCWVPSHGVIDTAWAETTWPSNIPVDYGFYVVADDAASRQGTEAAAGESDALDVVVEPLSLEFGTPVRCRRYLVARTAPRVDGPIGGAPASMSSRR